MTDDEPATSWKPDVKSQGTVEFTAPLVDLGEVVAVLREIRDTLERLL